MDESSPSSLQELTPSVEEHLRRSALVLLAAAVVVVDEASGLARVRVWDTSPRGESGLAVLEQTSSELELLLLLQLLLQWERRLQPLRLWTWV
jgi:hypothetical protein